MIIPIRCFTCGKVLADKYDYYVKEVQLLENKMKEDSAKPKRESAKVKKEKEKEAIEYQYFDTLRTKPILDKLGLTRYCCRRHMLATVDMMDLI